MTVNLKRLGFRMMSLTHLHQLVLLWRLLLFQPAMSLKLHTRAQVVLPGRRALMTWTHFSF
jgi:hypothetical protein